MSKKEKKVRSLKQILLSSLGRAWIFWPPRLAVKKRCRIQDRNDAHNGWFVCEKCGEHREKIDIDHIIPCIRPADGFVSWDDYISSRFVEDPKLLQGICSSCHKEKSKQENLIRKLKKKKQFSQTFNTGKTMTFNSND